MGLFSFFKQSTIGDYAALKTDMHSHLLPGIDDGAKDLADSVEMLRQLVGMGYQKIITTPHIMGDYYRNTPEIIRSKLAEVQAAATQAGIEVEIEAAAEYYIDGYFNNLLKTNAELLTFSGHHLLIEFSTFAPPSRADHIIFELQTRGYKVVLAHPERYIYYANTFEQFQKFKSMGCILQVNLLSLTGYYGPLQKKLALKLLKSGLVDYLGTDLHRQSQLPKLAAARKYIPRKLWEGEGFKNSDL